MGVIIALAVMLLIMFLRIGIHVRSDGELALKIGVGIFKISLYPKKEKKIKLSDYKIEKFRKKQEKLEGKKSQKKQKKTLRKKKSTAAEDKSSQTDVIKEKSDAMGLANTVLELVKVFLDRFGHHLHIKVERLVIIIGSSDAASTAILYGAVCGAVQCIVELFENCFHTKYSKNAEVRVTPDFTMEKTSADVGITFSLRVWQIFDTLIRTGIAYLKKVLNET